MAETQAPPARKISTTFSRQERATGNAKALFDLLANADLTTLEISSTRVRPPTQETERQQEESAPTEPPVNRGGRWTRRLLNAVWGIGGLTMVAKGATIGIQLNPSRPLVAAAAGGLAASVGMLGAEATARRIQKAFETSPPAHDQETPPLPHPSINEEPDPEPPPHASNFVAPMPPKDVAIPEPGVKREPSQEPPQEEPPIDEQLGNEPVEELGNRPIAGKQPAEIEKFQGQIDTADSTQSETVETDEQLRERLQAKYPGIRKDTLNMLITSIQEERELGITDILHSEMLISTTRKDLMTGAKPELEKEITTYIDELIQDTDIQWEEKARQHGITVFSLIADRYPILRDNPKARRTFIRREALTSLADFQTKETQDQTSAAASSTEEIT